ncbi:MAG TPA: hypothetical protein VIJ06_06390 [Methylovirgula sp.]
MTNITRDALLLAAVLRPHEPRWPAGADWLGIGLDRLKSTRHQATGVANPHIFVRGYTYVPSDPQAQYRPEFIRLKTT